VEREVDVPEPRPQVCDLDAQHDGPTRLSIVSRRKQLSVRDRLPEVSAERLAKPGFDR
jgi:hypothetical protein